MAKKYVIYPGMVRSLADSQYHHVGADELAKLYGVSLAECDVCPSDRIARQRWSPALGAIELRPRHDGNYSLPSPA